MALILSAGTFLYSIFCSLAPCDLVQYPTGSYISADHYEVRESGKFLTNPYPIVKLDNGAIRGYSMGSMQGNQIFAFEGIRYGESTGGEYRFKSPAPAKPWAGIQPAFKPGPLCLQVHPAMVFRVVGSEDCLFLNVYTTNLQNKGLSPERNDTEKFPVIVFFHGGCFIFGEGSEYGPAYLTDNRVILVTINYRLGVMGFMSTGDDASPGNYGLKDQALALKWVHENIERFGGDPGKVTIMGQSAGAAAVHLHLLSNKTREYFQGAIAFSAGAFNHWALKTAEGGKNVTKQLARIVKCPTTTTSNHEIVHCFKKMDPNLLVGYQLQLLRYTLTPPFWFVPVVEPEGKDAFISSSAEELYERDEVAKYPLISTMIQEEGTILLYVLEAIFQLTYFRRNFDKYFPVALGYDLLVQDPFDVTQKIRNFYFGTESPETVPADVLARVSVPHDNDTERDPISERFFTQGIIRGIKSHAQVAPTYSYLFRYKGRFTFLKNILGYDFGNGHLDDTLYILNSTRFFIGLHRDDREYKLSQIITNLIGNFAWKREPLYTNDRGHDVKIWDAVEPGREPRFLQIDKDVRMVDNPFTNRTAFWETLGISDTMPFKPRKRIKSI